MIINSTPDNLATLGNVTEVSEFKIRNSAKAFGILSSGLYANKIRAIIRELSCNAVDSHVAAGTPDLQFDVHLPTALRPYFSIRDYGTGLSHEQVLNIYTTYFESTKTNSNDFIGALGLGSKSPFSYTDNFTVIAIKGGKKGVYSAFINDQGVPAVAVMGQGDTEEPNGVEVKFAVTEQEDFRKFNYEASQVYRYFPLQPNFTGADVIVGFVEYEDDEIVENVRQRNNYGHSRHSFGENRAIMGNIEYPIELPKKGYDTELSFIDNKGLDLFFDIGEIDFQASREGLQYTEKTVNAIVEKYKQVSDVLAEKFVKEAKDITNKWELAAFVVERSHNPLWTAATSQYCLKYKPPFLQRWNNGQYYLESVELSVKDLATKFNISVRRFSVGNGYYDRAAQEVKPNYSQSFTLKPDEDTVFVKNPENKKVWEQSKYHFKTQSKENNQVWVLFAADPALPVKIDEFFKSIHNPPAAQIFEVSDLVKREVKSKVKHNQKMSTLKIALRRGTYKEECVWEPYTIDTTVVQSDINYYVPIKGYQAYNKHGQEIDVKKYYLDLHNSNKPVFKKLNVFGVRKDDIDIVKGLSNWVLLDDLLEEEFGKITKEDFVGMMITQVDKSNSRMYSSTNILSKLDPKSPFSIFGKTAKIPDTDSLHYLADLCKIYAPLVDVDKLKDETRAEIKKIHARYPMLTLLRNGYYDDPAVVEYIQFVDQHKGLN